MTVIKSFNDLDHINSYYKESLKSMILITSDNISEFVTTYSISAFPSNDSYTTTPHYLYIGSKTSYRKEIHPNIPNVLYKKFYSALKSSQHILEAKGSHVLVQDKPIDQSVFDSINTESKIDDQKLLNQLLDNFSNINSDNQYYINYIVSLEEKYQELVKENQDLREQIYNAKISTWY